MDSELPNEIGMASRATYRIAAKGKLDEHWVDWFNGTLINFEHNFAGNPHTILTCQVRDQAELLGILNRLNSLNLPLLQVELITNIGESHAAPNQNES